MSRPWKITAWLPLVLGAVCLLVVGCATNAERLHALAAESEFLIVQIEHRNPAQPRARGFERGTHVEDEVRHVAWDIERGVGLVLPDANNVVQCRPRWTHDERFGRGGRDPASKDWEDMGWRSDLCGMRVCCLHPPIGSRWYPKISVTGKNNTWTFDGRPGGAVYVSDASDETVPYYKTGTLCWLGLVDGTPKRVRSVSIGDGVGGFVISPDGKRAVGTRVRTEERSIVGNLLFPMVSAVFPPQYEFAFVYADISGSSARTAVLPLVNHNQHASSVWSGWIRRDLARDIAIETIVLPASHD